MKYKWVIFFAAASLSASAAQAADLSEIYQRAFEHDPLLSSIRYERDATEGDKDFECGKLWPQLTVPVSYTTYEQDKAGSVLGENSANTTGVLEGQQGMVSVGLGQTLFDMPKFMNCRKAVAEKNHGDVTYELGQEDLIYRIVHAYMNDIAAQSQMTSASSMVELRVALLTEAKNGYAAKTVSQLQLNAARDQLKAAQASKAAAHTTFIVSHATLEDMFNEPIPAESLATLRNDMPITLPNPNNPEYWAEIADKGNLQLFAKALTVESSQYAMKAARGKLYPTVNLFARHSMYDNDFNRPGAPLAGDDDSFTTNTAGVEMKFPLFTGGSNLGAARAAQNRYKSSQQQFDADRRAIRINAQKAVADLQSFEAEIASARMALQSANDDLEAARVGVNAGTKTKTDLLGAESQMLDAKTDFDNARFAYVMGMVEFWRSIGILSRSSVEEINGWLEHPQAPVVKTGVPDMSAKPPIPKSTPKRPPEANSEKTEQNAEEQPVLPPAEPQAQGE